MALAALTGPDAAHFAHIQRQTAGAVGLARAAKRVVHVAKHIRQRKFRVPGQERGHLPFILFGGKGAGGVDHLPARREDGGGVVQDLRTQRSALLHQRFAVLGDGHRLLAEHPLAGTGRIHEDTVEELRQGGSDAGGVLVEDDGIRHAHPFEVAFQHLCAGGHILIADEQAPAAQCGSKLAALAAGRGAQVQDPHPRPDAQQRCGRGCGRLLRVKHARMVVWVASGFEGSLFDHEARLAERRWPEREVGLPGKRLRRRAQRRDRHPAGCVLGGCRVQRLVPPAQQRPLPALKIFRRHERSSHV